MKKIFISLSVCILLFNLHSNAQCTFTSITSGPVVQSGGNSFGSAWLDYDNDNFLDLIVANKNNAQQNFFYRNNTIGAFTSITTQPITSNTYGIYSVTAGDYDNDDDLDVFMGAGTSQRNLLFQNGAPSVFSQILNGPITNDIGSSDGAAWADYDNDGLLDLFVANNSGSANFLYHNDGNGTFTRNMSAPIGTDIPSGGTGSGTWADYDNDGFQDLFVANFGINFLYHNSGNGTFTRVNTGDIVTDNNSSHGGSWGDYDNDGWLDLYVTNWYDQNNCLYHNNGNGTFTKLLTGAIVTNGGSSTGSSWGDYDNDGDLDLFVCNSSATTTPGQVNFFYMNNGTGAFTRITGVNPVIETNTYARSAIWGDYDNDGDIDLFVANEYYTNNSLFSNSGNSNNWINIHVVGTVSNHASIGARVQILANINGSPVWQTQQISSQTGYAGQNSLNAEFGLENASIIDSIIIRWPSGIVCHWENLSPNQFITLYESCEMTANENSIQDSETQITLFPNPANLISNLSYELKRNEAIEIQVYDLTGKMVYREYYPNQQSGKHVSGIDLSNRESGLFCVTIKAGNESPKTLKLVKLN